MDDPILCLSHNLIYGDAVRYGYGPQGDRECHVTEVYEDGSAYLVCHGWDRRSRGFVQNPRPKPQCYKNVCVDDYVLADLNDFEEVVLVARISAAGPSASVKVVLYHVDGNSKSIYK